jgi:hypothetical protein
MIESPVQNTIYKDGSPNARGLRRSCFKKYCDEVTSQGDFMTMTHV